ncbi:hypothetical protein KKH27_02135 [bacterium]|nr:hypothetical protein [bacterium]MBU1985006.1 hypothetical protein [bacterium]
MKRLVVVFLVSFVVVGVASLLTGIHFAHPSESAGGGSMAQEWLLREVRLIEYFCLSRIPPSFGQPAIPGEWEKALGTTIRLRQSAGEVVAMVSEFRPQAEAIKLLEPGKSLFVESTADSGKNHALVYRVKTSGRQYLVLAKPARAAAMEESGGQEGIWWTVLLAALIGSASLTGLSAFLFRKP